MNRRMRVRSLTATRNIEAHEGHEGTPDKCEKDVTTPADLAGQVSAVFVFFGSFVVHRFWQANGAGSLPFTDRR